MPGKGWYLLCLVAFPLLAGERDPFQPPEDRCQTAQLSQWHYAGAVGSTENWVGILRDNRGKWHRVRGNESLPVGWQIRLLSAEQLEVTIGPDCEPSMWIWRREKREHNALDKPALAGVTVTK